MKMKYQSLIVFILFQFFLVACTTPNFLARTHDVPVMDGVMHTVHQGETVDAIADTYHVTPQLIRRVNSLSTDRTPNPGTRLFIPGAKELRVVNVQEMKEKKRDGLYHWVAPGETLIAIANAYSEYDVTVNELQQINNIQDSKQLRAGEEIWVPRAKEVKDVEIPEVKIVTTKQIPEYDDEKTEPRVKQKIVEDPKKEQEKEEPQKVVQQEKPTTTVTSDQEIKGQNKEKAKEKTEPEGKEVEFPRKVERVGPVKFQWPLKDNFRVLRTYNTSITNFNAGIDLGIDIGTPVYAAANGEVQLVGTVTDELGSSYGNHIILYHGTRDNKGLRTFYAHLSETAVEVGQEVKRGEMIGRVGNTGRPAVKESGVLHFEVRELENALNPMDVLPPVE